MTMTNKLMEQLHQKIDILALNPMKWGIQDEEDLINFCIAYVISNLDDVAELWLELDEDCNEQIK